ncbi:MAG: CapA family protein [Oscillospiraceae bacterium]|nr:CapA family protein [Prevotella sp.]MBQ9167322.1 CapA family protein [Oscillospiraceae bacterium]
MSVNILMGADIVPTPSNEELFTKGDAFALLGDKLNGILKEADFIALNLEVPLTNKETPIVKCGPCLRAAEDSIKGLHEINPHFYTLANNHIMDQGPAGLENTITLLKKHNIAFAGVGNTVEEAARPYVTEIKGVKIGIYCCAEHEFSIVTAKCPGANPYDPLESFDAVRSLSDECDIVIVLYHGGKEMYQYPSPMLQKVFRKFADVGANVVIAQHTHCIGCMEEYNGSTLVYGQGNFLFDRRNRGEMWETSLVIQLTVDEETRKVRCCYLPLQKKGDATSLAEGEDAEQILRGFYQRSQEIQKPGFIEDRYIQLSNDMQINYYRIMSGRTATGKFGKILNRLTKGKFIRMLYPRDCSPMLENIMACEAHRELLLCALEQDRIID